MGNYVSLACTAVITLYYRPLGKVMFFRDVSLLPTAPSPQRSPSGQRPPCLDREPLQTETPSLDKYFPPPDRDPLCTENSRKRHLVASTAGVGTHPTGMHSCVITFCGQIRGAKTFTINFIKKFVLMF